MIWRPHIDCSIFDVYGTARPKSESSNYHIAELVAPPDFVGSSLSELKLRSRYEVQVIATKDGVTGKFNFVLTGNYVIKASDILILLGKQESINKLRT